MWFRPDTTDTQQFKRGVWDLLHWMVYGPALGAGGMFVFGLALGVSQEGLLNALAWGACFGLVAGVIVTGNKILGRWKA
jgi:hypothetical protein